MTNRCELATSGTDQKRSSTADQWNPAPDAVSRIRSPAEIRPAPRASHSASGTDVEPVLPYFLHLDENAVRLDPQRLANGFDYSQIGLRWHHQGHVVDRFPGLPQHLGRGCDHVAYGLTKDFTALHYQVAVQADGGALQIDGARVPPVSSHRISACEPSVPAVAATISTASGARPTTVAPAASPKSTQGSRSC